MGCVLGGAFIRGDDTLETAKPKAKVWLQTFYMDRNEVTVAAYKACVRRGKCRKAGPKYADFSRPKQPINGVSWFDADNYCRVHGKHLPTEAQWEKAARGTDGRRYPWGEHFDPTFCSMRNSEPGNLLPKPIGTYEADCSPYGVRDLSGGVREWVDSWFEENQRVIRGGAFNLYAFLCRAASRWGAGPHSTQASIGFRLVKVLPE